ncbi:hypothetical protein DW2_12395 [Thioclava atlantica]|uniref:DUF3696 domain-containing protein n=1 Tax=Thioclava atlantica TaxID=1317124 RepID=A0A085TVA5_9RHOB|nr:hypothetical protein DW2_12395 [Thioclava atlantica]
MVESHSDHFLNGIRLAVKNGEILAGDVGLNFFRRPSGISQPERVHPVVTPEGRLTDWPDGFFDQWDKSLDQLLS